MPQHLLRRGRSLPFAVVDAQELQDRITAFTRWQYRFEFDGGVRTPVASEAQANRHIERRGYFFDALLELTGGTLEGRRVLDLGCNAGFWSLAAIDAGADFVLGIDGREEPIEQAQLVFEAKRVSPERFRFEAANVFGAGPSEKFDIVLCLGFLDVTARPLEAFELMSATGADLIVIDTGISHVSSAYFEVSSLTDPLNAVDHTLTLMPSREAVVELAREFGYTTVALAHEMGDYSGLEDYRRGRRLAFICSRETPLGALSPAPAQSLLPWWASSLNPRELLGKVRRS
jgi:SAM-dependent methyltransferase